MTANDSGPSKLFGSVLRDLRQGKKITQEQLAERCGKQRASINMIEKARRDPSPALLRAFSRQLGLTEPELIRLLLAFVDREPHIITTMNLMERARSQSGLDVWVLSNKLGELMPAEHSLLESTAQALRSNHERVYFVPDEQQGRELCGLLESKVQSRAILNRFLRIVLAPEALCTLRIEIESPGDAAALRAWLIADPLKLEQFQLPQAQATSLHYALSRVLSQLGTDSKTVYGGFSLISGNTGGGHARATGSRRG